MLLLSLERKQIGGEMPDDLYDGWCHCKATDISVGRRLHLFTERKGARNAVERNLVETVKSHYEDPALLAKRIKRIGLNKASKVLEAFLPKTKKARSGHMGEILATEVVPAVFKGFRIPIKRLRWADGRESAMRGEDLIGISHQKGTVRFLKGESKSRATLSPSVLAEARVALRANLGRPSQHALGFIMKRLFELGEEGLAIIFETYMLKRSIAQKDLVHLLFTFSGNDPITALTDDLKNYPGKIEQHSINVRINDHQEFIRLIYDKV